eukprot:GHVU01193724.1.p1 GENE.GHVU01193724.1~~GHVU01193724.1.p1  ORF type:complete len:136 (+),score=21.57 GHVU01193724.1:169-576(+)
MGCNNSKTPKPKTPEPEPVPVAIAKAPSGPLIEEPNHEVFPTNVLRNLDLNIAPSEEKYNAPPGTLYQGGVMDGKRHGIGHFEFLNGNKYTGEWEDDELHGRGRMEFPDGSVLEGHFSRGNIEGYGYLKYAGGTE